MTLGIAHIRMMLAMVSCTPLSFPIDKFYRDALVVLKLWRIRNSITVVLEIPVRQLEKVGQNISPPYQVEGCGVESTRRRCRSPPKVKHGQGAYETCAGPGC